MEHHHFLAKSTISTISTGPFSMSQTVRHYQRLPYFTPFFGRHGCTDLRQLDGVHSDAVHQETSDGSLSAPVGWLWGFGISNMGMV